MEDNLDRRLSWAPDGGQGDDEALARFQGAVRLIELPVRADERGELVAFDHTAWPFIPQRAFMVDQAPAGVTRGGHAHKACQQMLVCTRGRLEIRIARGEAQARVTLDRPTQALFLDAGVWSQQVYLVEGSQLLVFASLPYDPQSYLHEATAS